MLFLGDYNCIPDIDNLIIYNLSSLAEGYPRVDILPPVEDVNYTDDLGFDIFYCNYIMMNDSIFYEFFSKIMYPLYNGQDIFLIVTRNIFYDRISETITKFIQQRYQYLSAIINDKEDIYDLNLDAGFGINGVYNLDIDKDRFTYLYTSMNLDYKTGNIRGF